MQVIAIDTETTAIDTLVAKLVGISIGWNPQVKVQNNKLIY